MTVAEESRYRYGVLELWLNSLRHLCRTSIGGAGLSLVHLLLVRPKGERIIFVSSAFFFFRIYIY